MQVYKYFDILSFVRVIQFHWIGNSNRMNSKTKANQVLITLGKSTKPHGGTVYNRQLMRADLKTGKVEKENRMGEPH